MFPEESESIPIGCSEVEIVVWVTAADAAIGASKKMVESNTTLDFLQDENFFDKVRVSM